MRTRNASRGSTSALGAGERSQCVPGEGLAEHGCVLQQPPFLGRQAVEPGGDQRVQGLGHLQRADLADRLIDRTLLHEETSVEQHPHRLDRIQRHPFCAREDLLAQRSRQTGHEPDQELLHRAGREWLEVERAEVALAGTPVRPALEQLRAGQCDHVQRRVARPFEQVLHEVEQARIRPLHVLEREHGGVDVCEPLEEKPPGSEQLLLVPRLLLDQPEQLRDPRLDEPPLLGIGDVLLECLPQLLERSSRLLLFDDPAPHPHHVCERPVGDAVAVGKTAPAVPVRELRQAVEVLVELPAEPRLADACNSGDRDQMRLALLGTGVEEVLDLAQFAVAADEGRLEAGRLERAARARDDPQSPPQR